VDPPAVDDAAARALLQRAGMERQRAAPTVLSELSVAVCRLAEAVDEEAEVAGALRRLAVNLSQRAASAVAPRRVRRVLCPTRRNPCPKPP